MTALRLGSLCTGYGGIETAVGQVLDTETVWHADPDPGASAILAHHWPHVPNLGDITAVDWRTIPPVDVLTAGYPCQPFSLAGRQKGTADDRHIWPHIATALRVLRPRLALLENVAGHLRLGFDTVLADLAALGFDAEWCLARADEVGAPHRRERLFVLAWPADAEGPGLEARREGRPGGDPAADAPHLGHERAGRTRYGRPRPADGCGAAADAPGDGRLQGRPEPARLVGGPDAAERGGATPADTDRRGLEGHPQRHREPQPRRDGLDRLDPVGRRLQRPTPVDWGRYAPAIRRWERATGRPAPAPTEPGRTGQPRLAPRFVEWLMGLDQGWVTDVPGLTRTQQLRALGNGVVPQQGAAALRLLLDRAGHPHTAGAAA
ncbi:DNA cytosine methyltransferase [Streptomyces sp. OF3]|uniref:DNA (cytosine-5-)-methyltransferase n=2 Tax=Streptomyces alkaliterrae TaxID=2213162 RepID=A0A7W3ZLX0_9ACTN|nr:DNA cytosine methyltransferase [Streptomyces alkaliterrae]